MKTRLKVCKCGRIYKWGFWYVFKDLSPRDQFQLITAYNQCRVEEIVGTCDVCKQIEQEAPYERAFGL